MKSKIRLGVNVDHIATLRQVRGGTTDYPNLLQLTKQVIRAGAEQVTIHLREDRRHIQLEDLKVLSSQCPAPLNLEMAVTPEMLRLALKYKPSWVCLVPEKREELTTEGGLNITKNKLSIEKTIERLQRVGVEVSLFIEPSLEQVKLAYEVGADAVELHTGKWVRLKGPRKQKEWNRLQECAVAAYHLEMGVHAGHGLDYHHTGLIKKLPFLREVNIGHSLICYALEKGLSHSVRKMKSILK